MERKLIAPAVHLCADPAPKFNRCRISIYFTMPAERSSATAHALVPYLLERGYADCPDMTQLTKRLARLYGAEFDVTTRPLGCNRSLCVSVAGIKDKFALEGEALVREYAAIAVGAAFRPYLVGGQFESEAVEIEKQMLKKNLEADLDDKRAYCMRQANREFFAGSPAAVRQSGYLEEVDSLTPAAVTAAYADMVSKANIELMVLGCDEAQTEAVSAALLAELAKIKRAPVPLLPNIAMPRRETLHKTERFDMVQAKLCMLFTAGEALPSGSLPAAQLAMALYGSSVTSRLFLNVREKQQLCYYCSSAYQSFTGSMAVNSGIEPADAAKAEQAVLRELDDLRRGEITADELEICRRGLLSGMAGIEDTLGGIEIWYFLGVMRSGEVRTPAAAREALLRVTEAEVRDILKRFTLSVSYLVTGEGEAQAC